MARQLSVPSLVIVSRSLRPQVLLLVTADVMAFGMAGGLLAIGLKFWTCRADRP